MKITLDRKGGFAAAGWILLIFFVIFIIVIFGVAYTIIRTFQKIVPPPPPDDDGLIHMPAIGSGYLGGVVQGYVPPPHFSPQYLQAAAPPGFTISRVYIFADDSPRPSAWTNCIWAGDLTNVQSAFGSNGLPMESWPAGQMPPQRFYNIIVSNSNQ